MHADDRRTLSPILHWSREDYREDSHQDTTENPMMEMDTVKNFLKNIKHFISKDIVLL